MANNIKTMAPPLGGLNFRGGKTNMPESDCIDLVNWIPKADGLTVREGYKYHLSGLGGPVHTVFDYRPPNSDSVELYAVTDDNIWNVTSSGTSPTVALAIALGTGGGRMYWTGYSNSAGNFVCLCSENGGYITYDGSAWTLRVAGAGAGQVDGVDPDNLCFVTSWKHRLWFIQKGTTKIWYSDALAITGTFHLLDVGPLMNKGGSLAYIASWTVDAGEGIDDLLVVVSEAGNVLIFKGTNPADAGAFGLVGQYKIGSVPKGRRCFTQYGGDLLMLSELGIQPISYVTRGGQSQLRSSSIDYIAKIQPEIARRVSADLLNDDWEFFLSTGKNLLMIRTPTTIYEDHIIFAMATDVAGNPWTKLTDMPAETWFPGANGITWFGTSDGKICQAMNQVLDAIAIDGSGGAPIIGAVQSAYSQLGMAGQSKTMMAARIIMELQGTDISVTARDFVDFKDPLENPEIIGDALFELPVWDSAIWDVAVWPTNVLQIYADWFTVEGEGNYHSVRYETRTGALAKFLSHEYCFEVGGTL